MGLSRTLAMQPRHSKKRKGIDVRATKGRRLKYVTMPKLQNFMAPEILPSPDIDVDVLFASLFGGK